MKFNFGISINIKTEVKLVEKIYIPVSGQSDEHDITTSPIPSKGGRLQRCITFLKEAIRFVKEKCQTVVSILLSLLE